MAKATYPRQLPQVKHRVSGRIYTLDARLSQARPNEDPADPLEFDDYPALLSWVFTETLPYPGGMDADEYAHAILGPTFAGSDTNNVPVGVLLSAVELMLGARQDALENYRNTAST